MKPNPALREFVRVIRAANDYDGDKATREAASLELSKEPYKNFRHSREAIDREGAIAELFDANHDVSPELRFALARGINGRPHTTALKPGRKPAGVKRIAPTSPRLPPQSPNQCIEALLDFGSTSEPLGLHPNTRRALADLLTGARTLKRGPRLAPPGTGRTMLAAVQARRYRPTSKSMSAAIRRAAKEAHIKSGTLQRYIYPRKT